MVVKRHPVSTLGFVHSINVHRGPAVCQPCSGRGDAAVTVPALVTLCLNGGRPGTSKCACVRCQAGDTVWSKRRCKSHRLPPLAQGKARRRKVTSVYLVLAAAEFSRPPGSQAHQAPSGPGLPSRVRLGRPSPPAVGGVWTPRKPPEAGIWALHEETAGSGTLRVRVPDSRLLPRT